MVDAATVAYEAIREFIRSGEFERGQHLPEIELAERVSLSRTPVREALRRLSSEGLVEFAPNRGARVRRWSEKELEQIYEARALLESYATRLAAENANPETIAHLSELADTMEECAEDMPNRAEELTVLNGDFHRTLLDAGGNAHISALVRSIVDATLVTRTFRQYTPSRLIASMQQHRELIAAIEAGDAGWAEAAMKAHILAARRTLRDFKNTL